jgi:predicted NBD/HSP70 family sugar kinase
VDHFVKWFDEVVMRNPTDSANAASQHAEGPRPSGGSIDQMSMRTHNLALVLQFVRDNAPCTRVQIATATGLTKAGVGNLVADLFDRGLLTESSRTLQTGGRPASLLSLDGGRVHMISAEINRSEARIVVRDLAQRELGTARLDLAPGHRPGRTIPLLAELLTGELDRAAREDAIVAGIGITAPALVDNAGTIVRAPALGWLDVDIVGLLRAAGLTPEVDIEVDNIANYSALAEALGESRRTGSLAHIEFGAGIGVGIVLKNELHRGAEGFSGAIGHIVMDPDGPVCSCGRVGCLEPLANLSALVAAAGTIDGIVDGAQTTADDIASALAAGRLEASALETVGRWVARGSADLINIFNPEVLVLGGYVTQVAPWLMPFVEKELARHVVAPNLAGTRVMVSRHGRDAALVGASRALAERVFDDPTLISSQH